MLMRDAGQPCSAQVLRSLSKGFYVMPGLLSEKGSPCNGQLGGMPTLPGICQAASALACSRFIDGALARGLQHVQSNKGSTAWADL